MFDDSEDYQEKDNTTVNYREEVIKLINDSRIKHTVKWAEKASDEKLEKTHSKYLASQLDKTNELLTDRYTYNTIFRTDGKFRAC